MAVAKVRILFPSTRAASRDPIGVSGNNNVSIVCETRSSNSPYIESVTRGRTAIAASSIRPAEPHWHMVFVRQHGDARPLLVGPWSGAGLASWTEDADLLWIRFELGTFIPRLPVRHLLDTETMLPRAVGRSFWLDGSA